MEDLVSVVVPVFGVEKYLGKCIESILSQTYRKIEVILVDDGSTDGSSEICDEYATIDKRIQVIHKENGGLVSARKAGVERCRGRYTAYVDGDDWIDPNYIEDLVRVNERSADMVICNCIREGDKRIIGKMYFADGFYFRDRLEKEIFPKMIFTGKFAEFGIDPNIFKLFDTRLLKEFQMKVPNNLTLGEDAALVYPMLLNCKSIYILNKPMYHYRFNGESITLKYNSRTATDSLNLNSYLRRELPDDYDLNNQLNYYHCLIGLMNIVNVARGGRNRITEHIAELVEYFDNSEIIKSLNSCRFIGKKVRLSQLVGLFLMKLKRYSLAVKLYMIKYFICGLKM